MPDLDLIKQGEQGCATGPGGQSLALNLPLSLTWPRQGSVQYRPD
jgi:hypothetical protein